MWGNVRRPFTVYREDKVIWEWGCTGPGIDDRFGVATYDEFGEYKKADAMEWLESRDRPSQAELKRSLIEKPSNFTGSTFPTDISTVRLTGDPQFIETIAGLFKWIVEMEDHSRRVEINLKETEDRDDGQRTGNYALYLSVTERR